MAASRLTSNWRQHSLASDALRSNPLGDPHERDLWVWSPADDSRSDSRRVYVLHAHMRSASSWFNVEPFERSYPHEIDALAPEAVVVLVDGWTSVGGSQWIDSPGIGRYGTYLCEEVVPFVDRHYPTGGARGLQGKSSGGYGAVVNALSPSDLFNAFAAHAPDALFDVTIARSFPAAARELRDRFEGSLEVFWAAFDGLHSSGDALLVELGAAALAYGDGTLPFDPGDRGIRHGRVVALARQRSCAPRSAQPAAAAGLQGVWLDAGRSDEYFLDLGATALRRALLGAREWPKAAPALRALRRRSPRGEPGRYPLSLAFLVESPVSPRTF